MIFHRHLCTCLILLHLGISPTLLAAEQGKQRQFSCSPWQEFPENDLLYRVGETYHPVAISGSTQRSELYPAKGMTDLELYTLGVDEAGEKSYRLMGKAPFPMGTKRALFFIHDKETPEGLPLTIYAMEDSLESFPPGTYQFFNFSPDQMHIAFAGEVRKLAPSDVKTMRSEASPDGEFIPFLIQDLVTEKVIYETRFIGRPLDRTMVFIGSPGDSSSTVSVKFLSEVVTSALPSVE